MDCKASIHALLDRLDADVQTPAALTDVLGEVFEPLIELPAECSTALAGTAEALLAAADGKSWRTEEKLKLVLRAMVHRGQREAFELLERAVQNEATPSKEEYVDLLDDLRDPRSTGPFLHVLGADSSSRSSDEARSKAIAGLERLRANHVVEAVMKHLDDPADRVRGAAIRFMDRLDVQEAAGALVRRVRVEDDPTNFEFLLNPLVRWKRREALPILRTMLDEGELDANEDMEEAARQAVRALEEP